MTRSVDDVNTVAVPVAGGRGGRDGDTALLFLHHPVHDGGALVDFTDLVTLTRVEQDALGCRGLTRVDVRHDADVANLVEGDLAGGGHVKKLSPLTSGSARTLCWIRPSWPYLRDASPRRRLRWMRR